jgi:chromosomal replication initiation ATPase DnaA
MAMEMCYRYCAVNQQKIGEAFGVDYSTVSQTRGRLKRKLQKDSQAQVQFEEIELRIRNLSR